ncbi:MAG: valine--tRNA ligase [Candidatus Brocadiales bacterium]|nr:valine--tRNA ligase [Candidatus Brocadiales bacterium]
MFWGHAFNKPSNVQMEIKLSTKYNPKDIEDKVYKFWEEGGFFHAEPDPKKKPYSIVIPPPNVTGALHMGHALNNILQDILIRWRRMQGYNTLWMPGTDHAGIATQNVVEKELSTKGKTRDSLGREKFIEAVWNWKEKYGSTIINQLKKLGSSCDWQRERFTMDDGLSRAVRETFVQLYERGLIYKGKYIINWCPRCRTALADDEVDHEEHDGHLWYIRYPFRDEPHLFITIATTRPETMLGDVAVAVNPADTRYSEMIGEILVLPEVDREIPIIADESVDMNFGTGAVKVTPAHDPNDFDISKRHNLKPIVVMNEDGTMNANANNYAGMDRYECREALVEELKQKMLLWKIEPHKHAVGHCYRCHTVVEPYLSDQWFVKMKPLSQVAIEATKNGLVTFYPERWANVYLSWLENVHDWCISRQIWWGHRIPAWYCKDCGKINVNHTTPQSCSKCGSKELKQDEDVLDTWFSSALWPFSTMGWPEETAELKYYYPTSTLITDRGIIYFWVARMVMMGLEMMNKAPFSHVYIHGTILDEIGRKMSKSLGNGIDPLLMIDRFGADAVRLSLIMLTTEGQDIKLSESKFEMGRNFINKVWNASRFALMNLKAHTEGGTDKQVCPWHFTEDDYAFEDKWILSRLNSTVDVCTSFLENYRFNEAIRTLYEFIWHEFCDWYLEIIKPRLYNSSDNKNKVVAQHILSTGLDKILRLLHPFAPYVTEELWQNLKKITAEGDISVSKEMGAQSIMISSWPMCDNSKRSQKIEGAVALIQNLVRAVRNIRSKMGILEKQPLKVIISVPDEENKRMIESHKELLRQMANLDGLEIGIKLPRPKSSASEVMGEYQTFVPLVGLIDLETEKTRQQKRIAELRGLLTKVHDKLSNKEFIEKAPEHIVNMERQREAEFLEQITKLEHILLDLD